MSAPESYDDIAEEGRRHIARDHLRDDVLTEIQALVSVLVVRPDAVIDVMRGVREALGRLS